jgi:hypothetical protein
MNITTITKICLDSGEKTALRIALRDGKLNRQKIGDEQGFSSGDELDYLFQRVGEMLEKAYLQGKADADITD